MLRIEIWSKDTIEWSLEGSGDWLQYQQAAIKLRSLFPDAEEVVSRALNAKRTIQLSF